MAEVQYIPYGTDEIDYNQFLLNSANEVQNYINSQPWSLKRKQSFLNAYQEIMKRGVIGASNDSGVWKVNHNGDPFPLETMSKRDREMYGEAAYFIRQQMSRIPTRLSIEAKEKEEAEKKKGEIPAFDNKLFTIGVNNLLSKEFGGREFLTSEWNDKDKRGENGLRGITERANILANYLEEYSNKLKSEDFNFEGSAFENIDDFKAKISKAVKDLRGGNPEAIKDSLNKIGLVYDNYFNTGGDDPFTTKEGYSGTYNDYYNNYLPNQLKQKQQAEIAKQKAAYDNQYKRFKFFGQGLVGKPLTPEKSNLDYLNQLAAKDTLNGDEQSELVGAFKLAAKNGALENLSKEELAKFGPGYSNRPGRLKKIRNVNGIYWDSIGNRVIKPYMDTEGSTVDFLNVLDLNNPKLVSKTKEEEYLNSKIPGITNAEWKELSAIGLDIASIINPEAVTGSGMALAAAGLRHSAKNDSNPDWSFGDYVWQGIDYLTGALGGILVLGDLTLSAKTMATASKAMPILRKIARAGAWYDLVSPDLVKDLMEASRKITSGEELTVKDWRAIGLGIRGLVSHGRLNRGNRAERRVLEKSGQNVTPENVSSMRGKLKNISLKVGFTRTKPANTSEVSTIKATINGKETEIEISSKTKAEILEKVNKAGNSAEARNKAVKEALQSEGKVKASDKVLVEAPSSIRDSKHSFNIFRTSKNIFGTKLTSSQLGNDVFNEYISGNRSYWDRYKYGSNTELKGIYNRLIGLKTNTTNTQQPLQESQKLLEGPKATIKKTSKATVETPTETTVETPTETTIKTSTKNSTETSAEATLKPRALLTNTSKTTPKKVSEDILKEIKDFEQSYGTLGKPSNKSIIGGYNSKPATEVGSGSFSVTINGKKINFKVGKRELKDINEGKVTSIRNRFAKQIQQMLKDGVDEKEIARILKKLKLRGWLKLGGTIEPSLDTIIENFLKNNNK